MDLSSVNAGLPIREFLTSRFRPFAERYARPLPKLTAEEVQTPAAHMDERLKKMGE